MSVREAGKRLAAALIGTAVALLAAEILLIVIHPFDIPIRGRKIVLNVK